MFKAFEIKNRKFSKARAADEHYKYDEPETSKENEYRLSNKNITEHSKNIILKGKLKVRYFIVAK